MIQLDNKQGTCQAAKTKGEPMQMRLKNGKFYAAFYWKGKFIGTCLGASEQEPKKAVMELGKLIEKLEGGCDSSRILKKFKPLIPNYIEQALSHRPETYQKRSESILKHLERFFGEMRVCDIGNQEIINYKLEREKTGAKKSTLKKELYTLKSIVRLVNPGWDLPSLNPKVEPLMEFKNKEKKITRFLEEPEALKIVSCADEWIKPIIMIGLYTGLRLSNVLEMTWDQIEAEWIRVDQTKNDKAVKIPISAPLMDTLKFLGRVRNLNDNRLFPHEGRFDAFKLKVQRACKRAHKKSGFEWLRAFHDYRHFFISHLVNQGVNMAVVAELAGHNNLTMTKRYSHVNDKAKRDAVESFGSEEREGKGPVILSDPCQTLANPFSKKL